MNIDPQPAEGRQRRPRPPSIPLLFAMMFAGQLGTMIYLPGMPDIARDLDTSMSAVQSMVATYLAAFAFAQLVMGPLSDRLGRRPVILVGLAVFAIASIVCATAPDISTLLWARVFQATGACATMVVGRAMIRDTSEGVAAAQAMAWPSPSASARRWRPFSAVSSSTISAGRPLSSPLR